jgi:hypothetical protein
VDTTVYLAESVGPPARTRTWNRSLEGFCDIPFTTGRYLIDLKINLNDYENLHNTKYNYIYRRLDMICQVCQTPLTGKQKKFCSIKCKLKHNNRKHQNYEKQHEKGKQRKIDLIISKGGKCEQCGYNKNYAALCFHHLDPNKKDLKLTIRELSNNTLEKIKKETDKCMLLCHNCHMEIHYPHYTI